MTVKPETRLWKTVKKLLSDGNYIVSRLESYITPGFPDCLVFHGSAGFFTVELKIINNNNRIILSPFQKAWNLRHANAGAPVFILVGGLPKGHVKLFHGSQTKELGQCTVDQVPGLYAGRLEDLDFRKLPNSRLKP